MYKSIAENFYKTGATELLFRITTTNAIAPYNLANLDMLDNLSAYLKNRGSLGSTTGERVSDDLLTLLARDKRNPLQLEGNETYVVTPADHFVVEYGTKDGVNAIWDNPIVPHLKDFGISVDPGVVARTSGAPDGGVLEQPTPIGTAQDPAMKLVFELKGVIVELGNFMTSGGLERVSETDYWKESVSPLLKDPLCFPRPGCPCS